MDDKITLTATRDFIFEACALVYSRWGKEYDSLKAAKAEKDDGSTDWADFHTARIAHATTQEAIWRKRSDEAMDLARELKLHQPKEANPMPQGGRT